MPEFNRKTCKGIALEAERVLREHFGADKIHVKKGNGTFVPGCFTMKMEFTNISEDGTAIPKIALDFKTYCHRGGFVATDLGRRFLSNGRQFQIVGWKPRASKRPLVAKDVVTNQEFIFQTTGIKARLTV